MERLREKVGQQSGKQTETALLQQGPQDRGSKGGSEGREDGEIEEG